MFSLKLKSCGVESFIFGQTQGISQLGWGKNPMAIHIDGRIPISQLAWDSTDNGWGWVYFGISSNF